MGFLMMKKACHWIPLPSKYRSALTLKCYIACTSTATISNLLMVGYEKGMFNLPHQWNSQAKVVVVSRPFLRKVRVLLRPLRPYSDTSNCCNSTATSLMRITLHHAKSRVRGAQCQPDRTSLTGDVTELGFACPAS